MRRRFCRSTSSTGSAVVLAAVIAAGSPTPGCAAAAQDQVEAVYKTHEVSFVYHSFVNLYACDELRNHVAGILRAVGARDDIKVRVNDCDVFVFPDETSPEWDRWNRYGSPTDRFRGRSQNSHVRVELMFPIEATPEVRAEIEKDKSRRELVSRVTGNPFAALNDPAIFPAQRQEVTLSRGTIRLASADPTAKPLIDPGYLTDPDGIDEATMLAGLAECERLIGTDALRAVTTGGWIQPQGGESMTSAERAELSLRRYSHTLYHPVGTARMGTDAASVVDPELRVRGVEGLRVADASVMPTVIRGHTNAPAIVIGEVAADLIRGR